MNNTDPLKPSATGLAPARQWLKEATLRSLDESGRLWLTEQLDALSGPSAEVNTRALDIAFGMAPRKLGKFELALNESERDTCSHWIPGWHPERWSIDQAARILLLSGLDGSVFEKQLERLLRHADLGEQLALYKGLPLYRTTNRVIDQASTGLRSNIKAVFESIAHHNPWPAAHLDEHRWNHLVLKALFVDSSLFPVQQLDERANPELARMLIDYARERRAAGRRISGELWRCAVPYLNLDDLEVFLPAIDLGGQWPANVETAGLALALHQSDQPAAQALVKEHAPQFDQIDAGLFNWTTVYRQEHCCS